MSVPAVLRLVVAVCLAAGSLQAEEVVQRLTGKVTTLNPDEKYPDVVEQLAALGVVPDADVSILLVIEPDTTSHLSGPFTDEADVHDRALRAKLLKAAGAQAAADFAAYATHAKKPDVVKLDKALAKSRETLAKAFEKALMASAKQGVSYAGPLASEVSDALVALVVEYDALTQGL